MDFINKNFNILKFLIPIVIVALLIPIIPIIIGIIFCIVAVNFIVRKLKRSKISFRKERIKKNRVNNDENIYEKKVIDVDYKEV